MSDERPTLAYGTVDTQFGITCEHRPDGGVTITVPGRGGRALGYRLADAAHPLVAVVVAIVYACGRFFGRAAPPRAVIELTSQHLSITEPDTSTDSGPFAMRTRTWPLIEVGEVRPNRYSKGIYVSVPGKDNFDLLTDLNARLVAHIGRTLDETLQRLRSGEKKVD
jgi:hypothetical protein